MDDERQDKRTLGVTPLGAQELSQIMATGWFRDGMDAYRLAISLAFVHDLIKEPFEMTGVTTKWNIGTIDSDGRLRRMVVALTSTPAERPYAIAERRAAAGLEYLRRRLVDENAMLSDIIIANADEGVGSD